MEFQNAIKQYKSPIDEKGEYRLYAVLPLKDGTFGFHASSWTVRASDGTATGTMHNQDVYDTQEEAIARYNEYLDAWEPETRI